MTDKQRQPPAIGFYPEAALQLSVNAYNETRYLPEFHVEYGTGISAEQAREAAHLLNQLAEYLECQQQP